MTQSHSSFLQSNTAKLFYTDIPADSPDAETILFLHGNQEEQGYFEKQLPFFKGKYRLVLMDSRGHGKSSAGTQHLDFSLFAQDLLLLMDHLSIPKAHLLGFSDGGNLALTFALSHPERVQSLILNGANLFPSGVKFTVQFPTILQYALYFCLSLFSQKFHLKKELFGLMVTQPHIKMQSLSSLSIPSLVIVGEHDMIRDSHSRKIANALPNCRYVCLKNADHFCAANSPLEFNLAVFDFLESLPR